MAPDTATNGGADTEQLRIGANDDLLMQVIEDQASDLEHSWREAIQNGLDAPASTVVKLDWDEDRSIISDNGQGVDLTDEYGEKLLTDLAESSKDSDDDETIGEFGIGKGQIFAKARTAMISGDQVLLFAIKEWGLDVVKTTVSDVTDVAREVDTAWATHIQGALDEYAGEGMTVVMSHYDEEVPNYSYKFSSYEDRVADRFQYAELATATRVEINGERISDGDVGLQRSGPSHREVFEGETAGRVHIGVAHGSRDDLSVYSNGVYVCDVPNEGLVGDIVVEGNLSLNFARNEIDSGCPKWAEITDRLNEIRHDLFTQVEDHPTASAREWLVEQMLERGGEHHEDTDLFRTAGGRYVSLAEVDSRDKVCTARAGDGPSDTLEESYNMVVLDKSDNASSLLIDHIETSEIPDEPDQQSAIDQVATDTATVDATEQAESMGVHTSYERLADTELRPIQRKKLAIARTLADRMDDGLKYPDRDVFYGESDVANGWTDGSDTIVITDSATSSNAWAVFVPELFRLLCHEFAHRSSSKNNEQSHGIGFDERFRKAVERNEDALSETMGEINDRGLTAVVEDAPKY